MRTKKDFSFTLKSIPKADILQKIADELSYAAGKKTYNMYLEEAIGYRFPKDDNSDA